MAANPSADSHGSAYGPDWSWSRAHHYVSDRSRSGGSMVVVIATGLSSMDAGAKDAMKLVKDTTDADIMVYPAEQGIVSDEKTAQSRSAEIARFAHGRPIVFINHSAGGDLSAHTAVDLIKHNQNVVAMWSDAPYVKRRDHFLGTVADAAVGLIANPTLASVLDGAKFYGSNILGGLNSAQTLAAFDPREAFQTLAKLGVPHLMTRGRDDHLVSHDSFEGEIQHVVGVVAAEIPGGHQQFTDFDDAHRIAGTRFLNMATALAQAGPEVNKMKAFASLGGSISSAAKTEGIDVRVMDTSPAPVRVPTASVADAGPAMG